MPFEARFRDSNRSIHTGNDTLERSADNVAHATTFARLAAAYAVELSDASLPSAGDLRAAPARARRARRRALAARGTPARRDRGRGAVRRDRDPSRSSAPRHDQALTARTRQRGRRGSGRM
jgi:hypothetical protein